MCSKEICEGKGKDCLVVALVIQFAGKSLSHTDYLAAFAFIPCYFIIRMLATNTTPSVSRGGVTNIPSFSLDLEICSICWLFPQGNKPVTFEMVMLFTCFESSTSRLTCKLSIVCNFEIHCNLSLWYTSLFFRNDSNIVFSKLIVWINSMKIWKRIYLNICI